MRSSEIRQRFLDFFKDKGHVIVPGAPLVVKNDPTLMFINSGMAPFKDIFLGNSPVIHPRIANTQKCLRVSGKHNDLEEVGLDTYHHTLFEMLGNWSFGDYFKKEAIAWAWELLTQIYSLDKNRLYVTVFGGSPEENLDRDIESYELWKQWVPEERILFGSRKDNFWEMGETGPCGPCSEIHYDGRREEEIRNTPGHQLVNQGHPEVIEIWNLVFMQYERKADGTLRPLPQKHVDTGMGLERLVRILQNKNSNYDTDLFEPLIRLTESISGLLYLPAEENRENQRMINVAMRVIADHIRTLCFGIADGQIPAPSGAGYVLRRILRRAVRYGFQSLDLREPFLYRLVPVLVEQMGDFFPELKKEKGTIEKVIKEEETAFFRTLEFGLHRIDQICLELRDRKTREISGKQVFELYDTYGFPVDLTALIAKGYGLGLDEAGFEQCLEQQKNRSRHATKISTGDWMILSGDENTETEFVGYDTTECMVHILRYRPVEMKGKKRWQVVLNKTPFYAEGGGQVGDTGIILKADSKIIVSDTQREHGTIVHLCEEIPVNLQGEWLAQIDTRRRYSVTIHHSATHLLHAALRQVLGKHVEQKGSLVAPDYLRFDFSHYSKLSDEEIHSVESLVNQEIRRATFSRIEWMPLDKARSMGAMALFGEKYGQTVRVVTFNPDFSIELCGGCHVQNSSELGYFKILSESAIASGIRRIEAIAGPAFDNYLQSLTGLEKEIRILLKNPKDVLKSIHDLQQRSDTLEKEKEFFVQQQKKSEKEKIIRQLQTKNGIRYFDGFTEIKDPNTIRSLLFELKNELKNTIILIKTSTDRGMNLSLMITDDLLKEKAWDATVWIRQMTNGKGGGQKFLAMGSLEHVSDQPLLEKFLA